MINSVRGFYTTSLNAELRQDFLDQLNICWLYAPDEVIVKGYDFRHLSSVGMPSDFSREELQKLLDKCSTR